MFYSVIFVSLLFFHAAVCRVDEDGDFTLVRHDTNFVNLYLVE